MIHIEVDTQAEIVRIGQRLERLAFQAPDILRLSINAAARKVRKQITKDAAGTYTIDESILKDRSKGLNTHGLRHGKDNSVSFCCCDGCKTDTGIS